MRLRGILQRILVQLLCGDPVGFQLLIGNNGSHLSISVFSHIHTVDQSQILHLLMQHFSQPIFISLLRDQLHHQGTFHRLIIHQLFHAEVRHLIHLLHDGILDLLQDTVTGFSCLVCLKRAVHVHVPLYRGISVGLSLDLLHITDPDLYLGVLLRKIVRKPGFQILFHLIQKRFIRHCHLYLLHLYLFLGNKKRRSLSARKSDE